MSLPGTASGPFDWAQDRLIPAYCNKVRFQCKTNMIVPHLCEERKRNEHDQ
jgi:hypothetical protein